MAEAKPIRRIVFSGASNMALITVEGVVENGLVRVIGSATLPEHAKVYVIVPDVASTPRAHLRTPRLADPRQAARFAKQVIEVSSDGGQL